jgi:glutamyl-tRNA reductase
MSIFVCGINHKTAAIALRERVIFASEKIPLYLADLVQNENIQEAVLLSTCNRTEIYCQVDDIQQVIDWFCRQQPITKEELSPLIYYYENEKAVQHIMNVACGLDSLVLGEPQILGQMKEAFSESCAAGSVGSLFHRLFQQVFAVAKEVRSTTAIGACPVSVASTALSLLRQALSPIPLHEAKILLIGAGDTVTLLLRHLKDHPREKLFIVNRDQEKAKSLSEQFGPAFFSFAKLPSLLSTVDVVISATASAMPILTKAMMEPLLSRLKKELVMVDLAVPRDIEEAVGHLTNIKLFSIDDLKIIIQQHVHGREHAANKAHEVIQAKSRDFMTWLHSLDKVAVTIRAYRKQIEGVCHLQLAKAIRQLEHGENPSEVLTNFAHTLTNKLLHAPTVQLRQAGVEGRLELLELAKQLFSLSEFDLGLS